MKKIHLAILLALAGAGLATQSAQAQLSYTPGDLFIGFRNTASGTANDYLVDIGSATLYTQHMGSTFTVGNFAADLSSSSGFGTTWLSGGKTNWGVIGAELSGDPMSTLYVGHRENPFGAPSNPGTTYNRDSTGNQNGTLSNEQTMKNDYQSSGTATVNNSAGTFQPVSDPSSWAAFSSTTPSFGQYSGFESAINGSTTAGHALDLFQIAPDDATPGTLPPLYEGRFVIDNTGTITFTSAVPEPSTLTALAGGLGLLVFLRRRRAVTA